MDLLLIIDLAICLPKNEHGDFKTLRWEVENVHQEFLVQKGSPCGNQNSVPVMTETELSTPE